MDAPWLPASPRLFRISRVTLRSNEVASVVEVAKPSEAAIPSSAKVGSSSGDGKMAKTASGELGEWMARKRIMETLKAGMNC